MSGPHETAVPTELSVPHAIESEKRFAADRITTSPATADPTSVKWLPSQHLPTRIGVRYFTGSRMPGRNAA